MKNLILSISFFVTAMLIPNSASAVSVQLTDLATGLFMPVPGTDSQPGSQGIATFTGPFGQFFINSLTVTADQGELVDLLVLTVTSITAIQSGELQIFFSDPFGARPMGTYPAGYLIFGNFNNPDDVAYVGTFAGQTIEPPFAATMQLFFLGGPNVDDIFCSNEVFCNPSQSGDLSLTFAAAGDTVDISGSIRQAVSLIPCIGINCSVGRGIVLDALGSPVLPVAEPPVLVLLAFGLAGLALFGKSRRAGDHL